MSTTGGKINNGLSYFDRFANESPFTHIWSLAVEGQKLFGLADLVCIVDGICS